MTNSSHKDRTTDSRGRRLISPGDPATQGDVRAIASGIYDFLASTRRLGDRPSQHADISQSEMEVLHFVSRHPACGVSDIARLRFLRPSNVSATVRRLLDADMLIREHNTQDRRAQDLYVSEKGRAVLDQMNEHWGGIITRVVSEMDDADVSTLIKAMPALKALADQSETFVEDIRRRNKEL